MDLEDRFTRGFIAGVVSGIAMNITNLISYYVNIAELRYLDWAAVMVYGYKPTNFGETAIAQIVQLFFTGILGIIFVYLISKVTSRNHLFKGWVYSMFVWFGSYSIVHLYRINLLIPIKLDTVGSNMVGSSVYGLTLVLVLRWLDNKIKV